MLIYQQAGLMTMFENWDRQYRFSAGTGGTGFEIGETSKDNPVAMHISFNVQKADTETPNEAKISIWNLNPQHLAVLNEKDCVVMLKAGYGDNIPLIFIGTVAFISTELDGADRETRIEAVDGRVELRDTFTSFTYSGKTNSKTVIDKIAGEMGVPVTYSYNANQYNFPNGFSYVGSGRTALDKACSSSGLQWQIQNGILQIRNRYDTMNREGFLLSPETGLVGVPKKITISSQGTTPDTVGSGDAERPGYEIEYLMNGAVGIGDYIRFESREVKNYFRIHSIEMDGDNLEGDWLCTAKIIEA